MTHSGTEYDNPLLLRAEAVRKAFDVRGGTWLRRRRGRLWAVDGISFDIHEQETFALVGESGCGKTTTARMILLLDKPTAGVFYFKGNDVHGLRGEALRRYRADTQAVFQDPWSSLNPRMRVGAIIAEPLIVNEKLPRKEIKVRVAELLEQVGLHAWHADMFPHEFSGGQRQRITMARAIALHPKLIVLDEPVSALDVSVQAQIMNLLKDLQAQFAMSYLLIAHNLGTVRYLSNRVAVMYLGQIVEEAASEELFTQPMHPYTQALISAALPADPESQQEEIVLEGEIPSPMAPPQGCRFHTRCQFAMERCESEAPYYRELSPGHWVSCHLY